MEVITRASVSGVALYCGTRQENCNLGLPARKSEPWCIRNSVPKSRGLRVASPDYSALPSSDFKDQSHAQFYVNNRRSTSKDRIFASAIATAVDLGKASVNGGDADILMVPVEDQKKAEKKMDKKMRKQAKKAAKAAEEGSSSSSSSSESEGSLGDKRNRRSRKIDMENWRREWEGISQSPIMNSIPTFTGVIEQTPSSAPENSYVRQNGSVSSVVPGECRSDIAVRVPRSLNSGLNAGSSFVILPDQKDYSSETQVVVKPGEAASVEVCMGGKCKKAGAQKVISAFQARGVAASACNKCMKNCKSAVNIRVLQEHETGPRMHSLVGPEDVKSLSRKYFGVGAISRDNSRGPVVFMDRSGEDDSVLYM